MFNYSKTCLILTLFFPLRINASCEHSAFASTNHLWSIYGDAAITSITLKQRERDINIVAPLWRVFRFFTDHQNSEHSAAFIRDNTGKVEKHITNSFADIDIIDRNTPYRLDALEEGDVLGWALNLDYDIEYELDHDLAQARLIDHRLVDRFVRNHLRKFVRMMVNLYEQLESGSHDDFVEKMRLEFLDIKSTWNEQRRLVLKSASHSAFRKLGNRDFNNTQEADLSQLLLSKFGISLEIAKNYLPHGTQSKNKSILVSALHLLAVTMSFGNEHYDHDPYILTGVAAHSWRPLVRPTEIYFPMYGSDLFDLEPAEITFWRIATRAKKWLDYIVAENSEATSSEDQIRTAAIMCLRDLNVFGLLHSYFNDLFESVENKSFRFAQVSIPGANRTLLVPIIPKYHAREYPLVVDDNYTEDLPRLEGDIRQILVAIEDFDAVVGLDAIKVLKEVVENPKTTNLHERKMIELRNSLRNFLRKRLGEGAIIP